MPEVELAFRPASKPFVYEAKPVSAGGTALALACVLIVATSVLCLAQDVTVTGKVALESSVSPSPASPTVVWLSPIGDTVPVQPMRATLVQKDKMFHPHLLVVTRGSVVDFPNRDPWFHNVFSLFNGKRFDLGLYEAGTSRPVHFDREGISYIFCNIHPEMSAIIVVLGSPYFATTAAEGNFSIASVPAGRYTLHLWNENAQPATLQSLSREVAISVTGRSLGTLRVPVARSVVAGHKNKYGQDYEPPSPNNPVYVQP